MLIQAKRDRIAPISIFFMLYISRTVVNITNVQTSSIGLMKTDILISVPISMGITLLLAMPAIYCYEKHKSPFDVKWIGLFYSMYFTFMAGVNISKFSYFASTTLNPNSQAWIFSLMVAGCALYGAYLGIEGLSRFSAFAFVLLVGSIIAALCCNIINYQKINLYPVISSDNQILKNISLMTSGSTEIILFLCLSKKVNGNAVKPFVWSVTASYFTMFVLMLFANAVMGDAVEMRAFPIYTLFQLAKIGLFARIDVLYISFWIFGIFIKSVLFIYCSSISFRPMKCSTKCVISSIASFAVAIAFTELIEVKAVSPLLYIIPFSLFCVIIPILTLIFKKRNYGDELVERF